VSSHGCLGNPCTICNPPPTNIYVGDSWAWTPPRPQHLAPEDVEAIAQRVAELLRQPLPILPPRQAHITPDLLGLGDDDDSSPRGHERE
jgi:hypothetical protein